MTIASSPKFKSEYDSGHPYLIFIPLSDDIVGDTMLISICRACLMCDADIKFSRPAHFDSADIDFMQMTVPYNT